MQRLSFVGQRSVIKYYNESSLKTNKLSFLINLDAFSLAQSLGRAQVNNI